jgi:DNA replicative helicase MCM subunit Mcm2 (Cdc46/Mcm family)
MAKSQFLKFASKVAPVGIYTSGKGSSAAGLTASVIRDAKGEFYLEGGAMVLADGGLVCIDEFDKMRPNDRVAIHEAMEQQTISVAKAGITTVLNARAAVLAAANPVYGRYDEFKSASENIDLMTTILSRFDMIFLVRDIREEERDRLICQHVMGVHMGASSNRDTTASSAISELTYVAADLWRALQVAFRWKSHKTCFVSSAVRRKPRPKPLRRILPRLRRRAWVNWMWPVCGSTFNTAEVAAVRVCRKKPAVS